MSSSDSRSILSENFLERYQIISEIDGDSDSDHEDAKDSHEEPEEIEGDEQFDKQFAENPKFREWVLQKKSDASVSRDVRQKSAEDAYHVAEPSRTVSKSRSSHREPEICRSRGKRIVTRYHHSPSKSSARSLEPPKTKEKTHSASSRPIILKPSKFDGKQGSVESHLTQFSIVAERNEWNDREKADYLMCSLTGEASDLLRELSRNSSFDEVVSCLRQHYASSDQVEIYRAQLKNRRRRPGEPLMDLMKDVRRLFLAAYPVPINYMSEIAAKDAFITALSDRDLMVKVLEREPKTLDEAFKVAERLELYGAVVDLPVAESKSKNVPKVRGTVADNDKLIKNLIETQKGIQNQLTSLQEVMQSMQQQSLRESSLCRNWRSTTDETASDMSPLPTSWTYPS